MKNVLSPVLSFVLFLLLIPPALSESSPYEGIWYPSSIVVSGHETDFSSLTDDPFYTFIYGNSIYEFAAGSISLAYFDADGSILKLRDQDLTYVFNRAKDQISYKYDRYNVILQRIHNPPIIHYNYKTLARNPETYIGKFATIDGYVLQTIGTRNDESYEALIAYNYDFNDLIYVHFMKIPDYNLLMYDSVTIPCLLCGEYSYETIEGDIRTIPLAVAYDVSLIEE